MRITDNITPIDGNDTSVMDDIKEKSTHKIGVRTTDNIFPHDGKVNIVNDDKKGKTTHKNGVRKEAITPNDADVTIATNDGKQRKNPKSKFHAPIRKPNKTEERTMIGKAVEVLIISCMKNHVYKFSNNTRIQSEGGPIGLGLTGEVADCFMINWDKKFMKKCEDMSITLTMYSRFKDDIFVSALDLEKGTKISDGKLVIDMKKKEEDKEKHEDDITMDIVRQVAELINPMIKFTVDVPSHHENQKIAVLDLEIKMNETEENRIDYEFFEKSTKNPKLLLAESAINKNSKRTILTQECLRRMRNTKLELGDEVRNEHLNRFMIKMKNSGYSSHYRAQILKSAINAFEKMLEEDRNGSKPLYRTREWNRENRMNNKENRKINWYKNDKNEETERTYTSILFVPPTPGSGLLKELKNREEELNKNKIERIKIVEKGGLKMENLLTTKNPFKPDKCQEKWCPLCKGDFGEFKISCNTNNTGYRWVCKTCEKTKNETKAYEGETSRSIRVRSREHITAFKSKRADSVLYKHKMLDHIDENVEYELEITGVFRDALTRQANESVRIYGRKGSEILNSKSEFNHPPTARVVVEKKQKYENKAKQAQVCNTHVINN